VDDKEDNEELDAFLEMEGVDDAEDDDKSVKLNNDPERGKEEKDDRRDRGGGVDDLKDRGGVSEREGDGGGVSVREEYLLLVGMS
jgi:hypothetical protein